MSRILLLETLSITEKFNKTTARSSSARETKRNQPERTSEYALREPLEHRLMHTCRNVSKACIRTDVDNIVESKMNN